MPVEFLSDAEAAAYCRFDGDLSREDLDRVFFLDDADLELIEKRRGDHNRLGFALQLGTVRWLGAFLPDPTAVPSSVLGYVAGQLDVSDPACVGRYLERRRTRFEHVEEIKAACRLRDFAAVHEQLEQWLDARAWMTGDGPRAIFNDAISWLRERESLLPGVTTLARMVARARAETDERLWETLSGSAGVEPARVLDLLLEVPEGTRVSGLERWRKAPAEPTGKNLKLALARVAEIHGVGIDAAAVRALVPARRLVDVARYGMAAKAPALRRHPAPRRLATLVATVVHLAASSIDDCYTSGNGTHPIEVCLAPVPSRPRVGDVRTVWNKRHGGRANPLLLLCPFPSADGTRAHVCGPETTDPTVVADADFEQALRLALAALDQPDRHAAVDLLADHPLAGADEGGLAGLRNHGMFAEHELRTGARARSDWEQACEAGRRLRGKEGRGLIEALHFEIETLTASASLLRVAGGRARGVAVFLDRTERARKAAAGVLVRSAPSPTRSRRRTARICHSLS